MKENMSRRRSLIGYCSKIKCCVAKDQLVLSTGYMRAGSARYRGMAKNLSFLDTGFWFREGKTGFLENLN